MRLRDVSLTAALLAVAIPAAAQRGPAPGPTNLPPDVLSLACAPTLVYERPPAPLRITGGVGSPVNPLALA